MEQLFWGRGNIESAAAFLYFEKESKFQNIFHALKYKGKAEIGICLGLLFGQRLARSRFNKIDVILPVPLHKKRHRKRGYNQSEMIAIGLAKAMNVPYKCDLVSRIKATKTQTLRSRYDRWLNVEGIFKYAGGSFLENKHVLIVDDIITTGATIESFINEISGIEGIKISVAALAIA